MRQLLPSRRIQRQLIGKRSRSRGWPGPTAREAGVENLYFIGFFNVSGGGNIRMMDDQAARIADFVTGRLELPSEEEMHAAIVAGRRVIERNYPDSPRYGVEIDPGPYRRALAGMARRGR